MFEKERHFKHIYVQHFGSTYYTTGEPSEFGGPAILYAANQTESMCGVTKSRDVTKSKQLNFRFSLLPLSLATEKQNGSGWYALKQAHSIGHCGTSSVEGKEHVPKINTFERPKTKA